MPTVVTGTNFIPTSLAVSLHLCRAAMMEFEINMSEMPLGKLSKRHIERGRPLPLFLGLLLYSAERFFHEAEILDPGDVVPLIT